MKRRIASDPGILENYQRAMVRAVQADCERFEEELKPSMTQREQKDWVSGMRKIIGCLLARTDMTLSAVTQEALAAVRDRL